MTSRPAAIRAGWMRKVSAFELRRFWRPGTGRRNRWWLRESWKRRSVSLLRPHEHGERGHDMSGRLTGKAGIVTGGAGGIGSAVGELFCAEGAKVLLVDR